MDNHVYKKIEITGSSSASIEDAVETAIAKAGETTRNMDWFEVTDTRGWLKDNKIAHWQVTIKIGFRVES